MNEGTCSFFYRTKKEHVPFFRLSKKPWSAREGRSPLEQQSRPAACTAGAGGCLRRKIPFSRANILTLQFLRPEIRKISAKTGRGGSGGGACSLVHHFYLCKHPLQLVKLFAGYERVVIGALKLDYVCPAAVGGYVVYVVQVYYVGLVAAEEGGRV